MAPPRAAQVATHLKQPAGKFAARFSATVVYADSKTIAHCGAIAKFATSPFYCVSVGETW